MNYQKAYMNQIFSSSLMGQVAEMWRNQLLCDAIIKTGTTDTKAHRLVLVAACPMLQTMENATIGSHLEVRLSAEIKPESVQTFLKYLYEGFMMLTGDNYKDVEKIAKLLQVESVVRCCVDFSKCLSEKTGVPCEKRFGLGENSDSVYVRSSDLLKVQETVKRHSEEETVSPEGERKRQKTNRPTPPPPLLLPMHNPTNNERVSSHGIDMSRVSDTDRLMEAEYSPQVIQSSRSSTSEAEIMKDSIEIVHREPPDPNNVNQSEPPVQQTMGLSVASKIPSDRNTQIVNMSNVLPHSRASSSKNLHIQGSPHSSSSSRKPETAHSIESEPRTPETHKNQDRRHLLTGETHSRHHIRQNSHEMPSRKHESYPSNLPCSEILGTTGLQDLSSKSICSPTVVSSQPSSPYRPPIPLSHRQPNAAQMQKSFLPPMFRTGLPYDGRSYAGVPMGSLSHLAGLLPTSMAPPLPMSYNTEDSIKDHGGGSSVPSSPCTPSDKATKVMIDLLGTYTEDNASQARDDAHRCIVTHLGDPNTFLMDHLLLLKPVKFLEGELIHELLTIFVSGKISQYQQYYKNNTDFVKSLGLSHEQNLRKMRFLSFVQLAEDKKEIDYAVIQKEMQLEEAEIEDFIIDVLRTKSVRAKIDQLQKKVMIMSTIHRTFGRQQWQILRQTLTQWRENLGQVQTSLQQLDMLQTQTPA